MTERHVKTQLLQYSLGRMPLAHLRSKNGDSKAKQRTLVTIFTSNIPLLRTTTTSTKEDRGGVVLGLFVWRALDSV
jgi:hypothetical protein